ncbi:hypothetical protein HWD35_05790 [Tsukamurella tyrosinosolvens]|uniref:hypothetical protein n=1 Tax=Tsukamurella tyrosinosolvens TaxID=57704 RepID=UPI001CE100F5|nr:hypothetical protein [Tsukamurella tyrosinosolvens]MCA4994218.1 hypothetical protein [Tsukamurella tyrosinosolvens]
MFQIKRVISAFVLAVLVITGVNVQVGTGVANADCQSDWAAYWRQNSPGTPVPPMPPQWCQTQTQQPQPTMTPLPTGPTNTAIPSPVSPTSEPTTAPQSPTTAPQQSGNGAGTAPTAANPAETTKPFQLPGDTPPTTTAAQGAPVPPVAPSARASVPQAAPATPARGVRPDREAKRLAANCEPNKYFPEKPLPPKDKPDKWKKFNDAARDTSDNALPEARKYKEMFDSPDKPAGTAVDHVIPLRRLWSMDGFPDLPLSKQLEIANHPDNLKYLDETVNKSKNDRFASEYNKGTPNGWNPSDTVDGMFSAADLAKMCEDENNVAPKLAKMIEDAIPSIPSGGESDAGDSSSNTSNGESEPNTQTQTATATPTTGTQAPQTTAPQVPETTAPQQYPTDTQTYPTGEPAQPPATEAPQAPTENPPAPPKPTQTEKPADVPAPTTQAAPEPAKGWWSRNWKTVAAVTVGVVAVAGVTACVMATAGVCAAVGPAAVASLGTRSMYALAA